MSALDDQPQNVNFLFPQQAKLVLKRTPHLTYFAQTLALPDITLGEWDQEDPMVKIPIPGTKLTFSPFNMNFRVDEDMKNYLEIYNWLLDTGFPDNFGQSGFGPMPQLNALAPSNIHSDATLLVMTSMMNVNIQVVFENMFPISLGTLQFDTQVTDNIPLEASVTFAYRKFTVSTVSSSA